MIGFLRRRLGWRGLLLVAFALWLATGIYFVGADEQGVVVVLGRAGEIPRPPGPHWTWPAPIARVLVIRPNEAKRLTVGFAAPEEVLGRTGAPLRAQFLTGDRNIVLIRATVQYAIKEPRRYLFAARDVEGVVASTVERALSQVVTGRSVDDLLTTGKVAVQQSVQALSQERLDDYGLGVSVLAFNLESITPPEEVRDAFNEVASARGDRSRIVREAEGYANSLLPVARGEAARLQAEGASYADRVTNESLGDAARFSSLAAEYAKVPRETGTRLYLETMEEVLPRLQKTIVESSDGAVDLDFLRRQR